MAGPKKRGTLIPTRARLNCFALFDAISGSWERGDDGAWYQNGGLYHIMGYAGRGNTFKSMLSNHVTIKGFARYECEYGEIHDTELSLNAARIESLARFIIPGLDLGQAIAEGRFNISAPDSTLEDGTLLSGDVWMSTLRDERKTRPKIAVNKRRITPFRNFDGSNVVLLDPWTINVDSFSRLEVNSVENMFDKANVGESGLNMEAMKSAAAKSQIMSQLPIITAECGIYMGMTAHAGDEAQLDQYAPSTKKLAGLKGNLKIKRVPENFSFLTNALLIATSAGDMMEGTGPIEGRESKYPFDPKDIRKGDRDLRIVRFEVLRGKGGPTGEILDIIFSQSMGLQEDLTNFHFLKELNDCWGMEVKGNNQGFRLDILPDVFFTRKTVWQTARENPVFARALAITAACCYEMRWKVGTDIRLRRSMKDLYDTITAQGYDWNEILSDTVEYWYFKDQAKKLNKPTITCMTLMRMANREYIAKQLKTHPKKLPELV